jgi:dihydrofolate reductase
MAAFWPYQPDDDPMAQQLNTTPKHVATRTLVDFAWAGTHRLEGELADAVASLKDAGEGDIVLLVSGLLAHELMRLALVDEIRLFVHPLLLGTGKRLFRDLPAPCDLELTACSSTSRGTVFASYRVVHGKP